MPTSTGHTRAILASRVQGTSVYNPAGQKIGHVQDVMLDKTSEHIMFAVLGFGGFLGMGEKYHPVPWSILNFDKDRNGYVVSMSNDELKAAPAYDLNELTEDDGEVQAKSYSYYRVDPTKH